MYFAGKIGAETDMNAMETLEISFGSKGGLLLSVLIVILSTITETYLDTRSAAISFRTILNLFRRKQLG